MLKKICFVAAIATVSACAFAASAPVSVGEVRVPTIRSSLDTICQHFVGKASISQVGNVVYARCTDKSDNVIFKIAADVDQGVVNGILPNVDQRILGVIVETFDAKSSRSNIDGSNAIVLENGTKVSFKTNGSAVLFQVEGF